MSKHVIREPCCFGDALSLPLSCLKQQSFPVPVSEGLHQRARFFIQPALGSFMQNLLPAQRARESFYMKAPKWNWKRGSAGELLCRSWLDAKTGRFPFYVELRNHCCVLKRRSHPVCSLALHSTLCWGVSQTVKYRFTKDRITITSVRHTLHCNRF